MRWLIPVVLCSIAVAPIITAPAAMAAPATSKVENADPEKVSGERPTYPEEARQSGVEGKLTAWLHVDAKGNVTKVEIKETPGPLFSEEAIAKFSQWKFRPEVKKGQPIAFVGEYTVIFRLKDGQPFVSNS